VSLQWGPQCSHPFCFLRESGGVLRWAFSRSAITDNGLFSPRTVAWVCWEKGLRVLCEWECAADLTALQRVERHWPRGGRVGDILCLQWCARCKEINAAMRFDVAGVPGLQGFSGLIHMILLRFSLLNIVNTGQPGLPKVTFQSI
jgi:hypothetical protein